MNRAEMTRRVLLLEAARDQIDAKARALREDLNADARAEYEEQGSAQTWRFDIGTWSQGISKEAPVVEDPSVFAAWVKGRWPSEVMEVVNPAFQRALLARLTPMGESVVDQRTGELVPGLAVRPGGVPLTLRFKPNGDALAVADQHAAQLVAEVTAALGVTDAQG
ncbi:hypothetical protein ACFQS1_19920 [Paractinoplanes rhizophilus]|uniref:Uncharacterized protein n=1 Tax=Paractinoplanes rhizophilus TaxID=1416877 RepID=A0ABW2HSV0_9ACTN